MLSTIRARGGAEELEYITALATAIGNAQTKLSDMTEGTAEYNEIVKQMSTDTELAVNATLKLNEAIQSRVDMGLKVDLTGFDPQEVADILNEARQNFMTDLQDQVQAGFITQEQMDAYINSLEAFLEKTDQGVSKLDKIDPKYIEDVISNVFRTNLS